MANERRQFLNKINKRIYTLTKHGVDKQDVLDMVEPRLPSGAYITEFGQINVDPSYWESNKSDIMETLYEWIEMYCDLKQEAMKPYENFIGTIPENQVDKELHAMYRMKTERQKRIDNCDCHNEEMIKDKLEEIHYKMSVNQAYSEAVNKSEEIWKNFKKGSVPFTKLYQDWEEIWKKVND